MRTQSAHRNARIVLRFAKDRQGSLSHAVYARRSSLGISGMAPGWAQTWAATLAA